MYDIVKLKCEQAERQPMPTIQQHAALDNELLTAVRLIQSGLGLLQGITGANDFYHLPMLTLASGFERFMKTLICLGALQKKGEYPRQTCLKRLDHDLEALLETIIGEYFTQEYVRGVPAAAADVNYLRSDPDLRQLVKILSDFAKSARYHNLDVVTGKLNPAADPKEVWERHELKALTQLGLDEGLCDPSKLDRAYKTLMPHFVAHVERLARALSRLFTIGGLGKEARTYTGHIATFLFLTDDELGKRAYDPYRGESKALRTERR